MRKAPLDIRLSVSGGAFLRGQGAEAELKSGGIVYESVTEKRTGN